MAAWIETLETILAKASDLDEARLMLASAMPELDGKALAGTIAAAMEAAHAAGRFDVEEEAGA